MVSINAPKTARSLWIQIERKSNRKQMKNNTHSNKTIKKVLCHVLNSLSAEDATERAREREKPNTHSDTVITLELPTDAISNVNHNGTYRSKHRPIKHALHSF